MYSIFDSAENGPTFGGGFDIVIYTNANTSTQNYANVGNSFLLPGMLTFGSEESKNFMAGSYYFSVSEIEVFGFDTSASAASSESTATASTSSTSSTSAQTPTKS